ncbi:MAG: hypothetical protein ACXAD7_12670 [Candidatus Kariarchaeaceae archaeon]|jgi:DNA-binding transcriptional ArsR family regulator
MNIAEKTSKPDTDRSKLYAYWNDEGTVKIHKLISLEDYLKIDENPVRKAIIHVLREGIEDKSEFNRESKKRYAMSMYELLPLVNEYLKKSDEKNFKPVKQTALYYHRDELDKAGFIKFAAKFVEGKRIVEYYCRTAKVFMVQDEESPYFQSQQLINQLIKQISPEADNDELLELYTDLNESMDEARRKSRLWIKENENILNSLDTDLIELSNVLLDTLAFTHPKLSSTFKKLSTFLRLDNI